MNTNIVSVVVKKLMIFGAFLVLWVPAVPCAAPAEGPDALAPDTGTAVIPASSVQPGVYYFRFEPSFYTGFAPRCQDPRRVATHLGRGNQLRVTMVLDETIIYEYLADLTTRYRTYRELIDSGQIKLSQNTAFERFEEVLHSEGILDLAHKRRQMDRAVFRELSLDSMKRLNPGRVFHIVIDFPQRVRNWSVQLAGMTTVKPSKSKRLELVNSLLTTRLKVSEMTPDLEKKLSNVLAAHAVYVKDPRHDLWMRFYKATKLLFIAASSNRYPFTGELLDFYEFTAIYPVGTYNESASYDGIEMPLYPYPGKRQLRIHQRTGVVDHIPDKASYSYLPWIPYMHVCDRFHNSFHSLWFHIEVSTNGFILKEWKGNSKGSRTGKPFPNLWLLSRGPMSHGCTHVNAGHISELRHMLPSTEENLSRVMTYRNKSDHFDVFDIDGDGRAEVMGVKYFYAYSLKNKKPHAMRASANRKSFYAWLYKRGYRYDTGGRVIFDKATTLKFVRVKAEKGRTYTDIPLYEAEYWPETIQFYTKKPIPFVRELRRVSSTYRPDPSILKLNM
jgi:hypothetical protein